jgi:hypothetical protein
MCRPKRSGERDLPDTTEEMTMDLEWMKEIIAGREHAIAAFGPDPFAFTVNGKRMAIATDGHLMVAVPTDQALAEPRAGMVAARGPSMERYLTLPEAEPYEANLARLKRWAGEPLGHDIYFDREGFGPHDVPNFRSCILFDVPLDANKLALALQAFEGETVQVFVGGERDPVKITDGKAVAVIMPRLIPKWTAERGPIGSYDGTPPEEDD